MEALIHAGLTNAFFAAVLAVIVAGLTVLCRRRPAIVHALWVLVLVKFIVPSVCPVEIPWWRPSPIQIDSPEPAVVQETSVPARIGADDEAPDPIEDVSLEPTSNEPLPATTLPPSPENLVPEDTTDPTISPNPSVALAPLSWEKLVGIVWLTGSLAWMAVAAIRIVRFHRILRFANPANRKTQVRVRELADRLGLSVYPSIAFVSAPIAPLLWALTRSPRLLIPTKLWERLNEEQRDTLLVHELAHLRRGDHWVRRLEMVVLALYWWHPVVWWAQRQLREAEEQCCDAWVLWALPNATHHYAVALVETLAFLSHSRPALPLGASGIEPMRLLKRRLSMIVQGHPPRGMSRLARWAVVGLGLLVLPLLPVPAQQTGNPQSDDEEQVQPPAPPRTPPASPEAPALQPAPTQVAPPIRVDRAEQIEAARDQVDLMEAKLMIKRAELEEMEMRIRLAQRNVKHLQELYEKGALQESVLIKARDEAELLPTQLLTKKAELKEAEILLKQAQRRLKRLEGGLGLPSGAAPGTTKNEKDREIERKLIMPVSLDFQNTPFRQVVEDLRISSGINIVVDKRALEEESISLDQPVNMKLEEVTLKSALTNVLHQVKLTYVIEDEVLKITTESHAKGRGNLPAHQRMQPGGPPMKGRLPGSGGPMKAPPGSPASPGTGKEPPRSPGLPPGPGAGPPAKPPSNDAEGVVLNADARTGQVIISIGSASGIKAGSQLEVYRLKPNPKYLGKIEILAAQENRALGRLTDAAQFGPLQEGDLVAGKVSDKADGAGTADPQNSATDNWPDWAGKMRKFEVRDKPWSEVFEWLSEQTGLPVMMSNDNKPSGKFTYISPKNKAFTIPQIIDILNESLEKQNYLLFRRGENLYVVSTVIANPLGVGGRESDPPWANSLFQEKSWNFGTVQRGEKVTHRFQVINPLKEPVHISGARTSASFVKASTIVIIEGGAQARMTEAEAWISPHQSATIEVSMDT
jgi:beta-lactamase regulating signal transducer with metallopeptidase domain